MPKTKISEFSSTPASNTDIDSINIAEGCAPSGINDAIRELMAQLKDWQSGTSNDPMVIGSSGTLGVGGAASVPLDVYANSSALNLRLRGRSADSIGQMEFWNNAGSTRYGYVSSESSAITLATVGALPMNFVTNGSERMRLDSSGNLGLGVTPSAWFSNRRAMQIGGGSVSVYGSQVDGLDIYNNGYNASGSAVDTYTSNGYSTKLRMDSGQFRFFIAPSGTAGNAITFTQAMTLDASGNLLLSTTTAPSSLGMSLGTTGTVRQLLGGMSNTSWRLREGVNVDYAVLSTNINDAGTQDNAAKSSWRMGMGYGNVIDNWAVYRAPAGSSTFTQAMTLDASGNLLVGTTSATYSASGRGLVEVNGSSTSLLALKTGGSAAGYVYHDGTEMSVVNTKAGSLQLTTNGAERCRIDSSGNLLVGTTSGTADRGTFASPTASLNVLGLVSTDDSSGGLFAVFRNSAYTAIGTIARVTTTNAVVYNTTSDYRLKTVTGAVTGQGARIDALKPIDYTWKEGGQQARGFLAHEFQAVYANSVTGDKDAVDADGNPVYQAMQAATSEVIADLVAEIQSLRKRLADAGL